MGTTLTGTTPQDTYDSLIKVTDNGPLSGTLKALSDGLGNDSVLAISTASSSITAASGAIGLTLANSSGGTKVDFTVTENTGLSVDFNEGATARSLNLLSAGTSRLFISSTGRVGIGTTNPAYLTQLKQTSAGFMHVLNRPNTDIEGLLLGVDSSDNGQIASNNTALIFGTTITGTFNERMRITSAGRVGIGTSATSTAGTPLLQVNGSVSKETTSGSIADGATITLFTLATNGVYLVTTKQNDDVSNRSTAHLIFTNSSGTLSRQVDLATGAAWTVTMSGLSVQLTNTSLLSRGYSASVLQLF
jgi:hypothetical protein